MLGRDHLLAGAASFAGGSFLRAFLSEMDVAQGVDVVLSYLAAPAEALRFWLYSTLTPDAVSVMLALFLFLVGCLLPDIDTGTSILGRKVRLPVEHRTWTHALWGPAALFAIAWFFWVPAAWVGLGWLNHLFFDNLSVQGVCWLYPVPGYVEFDSGAKIKRGHWLKLYKTAQASEYVVVAVVCLCALGLGAWYLASGHLPLFMG